MYFFAHYGDVSEVRMANELCTPGAELETLFASKILFGGENVYATNIKLPLRILFVLLRFNGIPEARGSVVSFGIHRTRHTRAVSLPRRTFAPCSTLKCPILSVVRRLTLQESGKDGVSLQTRPPTAKNLFFLEKLDEEARSRRFVHARHQHGRGSTKDSPTRRNFRRIRRAN